MGSHRFFDKDFHFLGWHVGAEDLAGGRCQRHHGAWAQVHVNRVAGLFQMDDCRAGVSPDRQCHGVVNALFQCNGGGDGKANWIELAQPGQSHTKRKRTEPIAAGDRVL